jgi:AraC-like DNA-binding protein
MVEAVPMRQIGRFADLRVHEYTCTFGPEDRPFEEQHTAFAIGLVYEGTFQYRTGRTAMTMTPGSVMLGNVGQAYTCSHEHGRGDRCVSLSFGPETLEDIKRDAGIRLDGFRHATFPVHARHFAFAKSLLGTGDPLPPSAEEIARMLAADILRSQSDRPLALAPITWAERRRAVAACHLIETRGDGPLSLADVAASAGLSPFHFLRSFKRAVGVTPHQYLVQTRLIRAASLLLDTEAPVTSIAYDAGFADLANFNRSFRQALGHSPREMRNSKIRKVALRTAG